MAQTFYNIKYKRFKPKSTIKLLLPKYVLDKALYYSKNISNEKKLWKFKIFLLTVISKYFSILGEIYYYKKWVNGDTGKYTMI